MWCPHCGKDTRVLETDKLPEAVTRVRWCRNDGCKLLFETREVMTGSTVDASRVACPQASASRGGAGKAGRPPAKARPEKVSPA